MKIVLDTNLLVSGIFWSGTPAKILEHWLDDCFELCITENILKEYNRVIKKIAGKEGLALAQEWKSLLSSKCSIYSTTRTEEYSRDPDDDKFIYCALDASAIYIVSGDQDLLVLKQVEKVKIITAKSFLDRIT